MFQWIAGVFGSGNVQPDNVDRLQQLKERGRSSEMAEAEGRDLVSRVRRREAPVARTAAPAARKEAKLRGAGYRMPAALCEDATPWTDSGI